VTALVGALSISCWLRRTIAKSAMLKLKRVEKKNRLIDEIPVQLKDATAL
jgi:hypothetical protein